MTGKTGSQASQPQRQPEAPCEHTNLDRRYGEIGIMSVAAAMRYSSSGKQPAAAPAQPPDLRFMESAS